MMKNLCKTALAASSLLWSSTGFGQITVFENDPESWLAAAGETTTIDFESVDLGANNDIEFGADEFNTLFGAPVFTAVEGDTFVINEQKFNGSVVPTSGTQMLAPSLTPADSGITGVLRLSFDQPMFAISSWFLHVGTGFASTGFDIDLDGTVDVAFSENLDSGNGFLGFVLDEGISAVDLHFNSEQTLNAVNNTIDGIAADDVAYAPATVVIPEPSTYLLMGAGGLFMVAWTLKRRRSR